MTTERGKFITLEGGEGVGKSTQLSMLENFLILEGTPFITLREPGGTELGEKIRTLLLDPEIKDMSSEAELVLFGASRAQLVARRIKPAIKAGIAVVCDRFTDSTKAYQGYGRGMDMEFLEELQRFVTQGLVPDLTICLDGNPGLHLSRATSKGADRIEAETIEFHNRVRNGFLSIARQEPERFKIVDALGTPEEVHARVRTLIYKLFNPERG